MQEKVTFTNSAGHQLAGVLHFPPSGTVQAMALFAHCFTCTKNINAAVHLADALCEEGVAVLRFDFTGLGESDGEFDESRFSANVQDLVDAATFLRENHRAPDILVGHSLGGTAVLAAAPRIESAVAVATIGSPADANHVLHLFENDLADIESKGEAEVNLAGRPFKVSQGFIEDLRSQTVREGLRGLRKALLVMHSPVDELVSIDEAALIYGEALHPKSFVSLEQADHLLSRKSDSLYAGKVLAAWASRYIPGQAVTPPAARYVPEAVVAYADTSAGFKVEVNADGHHLTGDEPVSVGGTDLGPSPYEYLSAALGTCTAMTINFFARREDLPLENVEVVVRHDRIHAKDCAHCDTESGRIDRLHREIRLRGALDEDQRALLMKIADRCPVHKTLDGEILMENSLVEEGQGTT